MESHSQHKGLLLAGAIKRPITPTIQGRRVYFAGDERGRRATDIHDELWVRAVAIRHDDVTVVLVALDLLGFLREHVMYVRESAMERGIPAENLIVTCTRNHAGPDTIGRWSKGWLGSGFNLRYVQFLRRQVVEVICLAVGAMEPVQVYLAREQVSDLLDDGKQKELDVLQVRALTGRAIATVVNFPLVPQVLDQTNTLISADFANWLYQSLEPAHERDHVTLYTCAEANEHPAPAFRERSLGEAERIGVQLAATVREALRGAPPTTIEWLQMWKRSMTFSADDVVTRWLRQVTRLSGNGSARLAKSEVGLVQIGPARIAAVPGLLAPQVGSQVRKMLDAPYRFVLGVSNDDLGVIPSQEVPVADKTGSPVGTIVLDGLDELLLSARSKEEQHAGQVPAVDQNDPAI